MSQGPILSQTNQVNVPTFYSFKIKFNITPSALRFSKWLLSIRISHQSSVRVSLLFSSLLSQAVSIIYSLFTDSVNCIFSPFQSEWWRVTETSTVATHCVLGLKCVKNNINCCYKNAFRRQDWSRRMFSGHWKESRLWLIGKFTDEPCQAQDRIYRWAMSGTIPNLQYLPTYNALERVFLISLPLLKQPPSSDLSRKS